MLPSADCHLYAFLSGAGEEEAVRLGSLLIEMAKHSAADCLSSSGWIEAKHVVDLLVDEGFDRPWSRLMRALGTLPKKAMRVLGVKMFERDEPAVGPP
eukprot:887020-Pyramimonas_sp.AAC.2